MSRVQPVDLAEHHALVEGLPGRLGVAVAAGALSTTEAHQCLELAREVLAARLAERTDQEAR